jgi:hypothetical protein
MGAEHLVSRLEGVRQTGPERWMARCPAHDDIHPSLSIRETSDGTVLMKCFAGCCVADITAAVGIQLSDLFPAKFAGASGKRVRQPFFRDQVFNILRDEAGFVWLIACDMHAKRAISERDYERLCQAVAEIERIAEASYGL